MLAALTVMQNMHSAYIAHLVNSPVCAIPASLKVMEKYPLSLSSTFRTLAHTPLV